MSRRFDVFCAAFGAFGGMVRDGLRWEPLEDPERLPELGESGVILLDSYRIDADRLADRVAPTPVVSMHDHGPIPNDPALVVSPATQPSGAQDGRVLAGFQFACLRPSYWGLPQAEPPAEVRRVLVTVGGGALAETGRELAEAARDAVPDAEVLVVRGPYARAKLPDGVTVIEAVDTLVGPLRNADLVVSAGGQTMLEAAAVGVPALAVPLADNQRPAVEQLAAAGGVLPVESPEAAAPALAELAADHSGRQEMARRAQEAVDGYGALRVGWQITQLLR